MLHTPTSQRSDPLTFYFCSDDSKHFFELARETFVTTTTVFK